MSEPTASLEALVASLFDARVRTAVAPVEDAVALLAPAERALLERAVESRRREFSTGRRLAHRLLREMGHPSEAILRDADRVPIWPAAVHGSISHSRELAVVALCEARAGFGVGVDVEPDEPVKPGIERIVCTDLERRWLDRAGGDEADRGRRVKRIFSAKEATYKAFYPRVRVFWGFHDVTLVLDESGGRFEATLPVSAGRARVEGRFVCGRGAIVSGVFAA